MPAQGASEYGEEQGAEADEPAIRPIVISCRDRNGPTSALSPRGRAGERIDDRIPTKSETASRHRHPQQHDPRTGRGGRRLAGGLQVGHSVSNLRTRGYGTPSHGVLVRMEQAIAMRIVEAMTCMSQIDDLLAEVAAYS